jgi:hypothetical protein
MDESESILKQNNIKNRNVAYVTLSITTGLILVAIVIFSLTMKSNRNVPSKLSHEVYNLGVEALNITDQYLDREIDTDEARDELSDIRDRIDLVKNLNNDENVLYIDSNILMISSSILNDNQAEILDFRNDLAYELKIKKR